METFTLRITFILAVVITQTACTTPVPTDPKFASIDNSLLPTANSRLNIPGLSPCTTTLDRAILLNSDEPVNVIVHGCFGSAALFRSLAQVFAFHGQQTICFNYNDRDSLTKSSADLIEALELLSAKMNSQEITVIGHSQGGLIARKAVVKKQGDSFQAEDISLRLVTISAPFFGITAADHCGSYALRLLSLGLVVPVCMMISGDKWFEITSASSFIRNPGELLDQVSVHLKIVTDEAGSCRRYEDGVCIEDDFVFSVDEQYFERVDSSPKVENVEVIAGHAEIVGDYQVIPAKLITLLQAKGIMHSTPVESREDLVLLLSQIYRN